MPIVLGQGCKSVPHAKFYNLSRPTGSVTHCSKVGPYVEGMQNLFDKMCVLCFCLGVIWYEYN